MPTPYTPPYTITSAILSLVAEIAGEVGRLGVLESSSNVPKLRRENRIRTIHASLAIENNTLSLDQVTAVLEGKRVLGPPKEVQEVKNAFAAYEAMTSWRSWSVKDLLAAHRLMLGSLVADAGKFRFRSVGIAQGKQIVHLAPPADRVPGLMKDLLGWLKRTDAHPLIAGCAFHYELEFIHPFTDGNGRIGRLWQMLILSQWNPLFAFLPVETVIRDQQADYYKVLATCDKAGNSTAFIEFLLSTLLTALREAAGTDQVSDQVTDQVAALLRVLGKDTLSALECMKRLKLSHRPTFRSNYLNPALTAHLIPFSESRNDHPTNGLALCKNHHWAMDRDIIAPGPDLHWHVSKILDPRRSNGERELAELSGKSLLLPKDRAFHPDAEGLAWRYRQLSA